jgi:hypothetical protein
MRIHCSDNKQSGVSPLHANKEEIPISVKRSIRNQISIGRTIGHGRAKGIEVAVPVCTE